MLLENENIVLEQAITAFNRETGVRLYIVDEERAPTDERIFIVDAILGIKGYEPLQFAAEIKKWVQHTNFGVVIEQVKRLPLRGLLVADYVNPNMAERLREEEVQFIDTAGNAYINADPLFIYVKGNKNKHKTNNKKEEKRRAFTQTGLKVIYAFLCDPELVRAAYRDIADKADVALGTVGWVVGDLKEMGYLIDRGDKKTRRLNNYEKLLDKWVEMYPAILRPKQFIGEYNREAPMNPKNINIKNYDAYWGGETAGQKYTKYLKPEIDTIYIPENKNKEFIHNFKLYKNKVENKRTVKLYKPFWKKPNKYDGYVHPILAYADLIATGDARNRETARMIKDDYIRPIWKD